MKRYLPIISLALLLSVTIVSAQTTSLIPDTIAIKRHISALAADSMEGRETGTKGEEMASKYIVSQFTKIGLIPKGNEGYLEAFPFNAGSFMGKNNFLKIGDLILQPDSVFFPLGYSANGQFKGAAAFVGHGISSPKMNDYEGLKNLSGKVFVMEYGFPEDMDPHSKMAEYADIRTRIDSAVANGAKAVIFVNSSKETENPVKNYSNRITPTAIPVIFVKGMGAKLLNNHDAQIMVEGKTEILKNEKTGHNILGYIDNKSTNTVIIGAHYDHLGWGIEGSLYRGEKAIHNGADDNASGTAAMIEFARLLKNGPYKNNNYLFIAFSGEEMGLLGSNFLVKHSPFPMDKINYMLNMDMVGRLKKDEPVLLINGVGTSPAWNKVLPQVKVNGISTKTTESGVGPSDHTSFYLQNVPVLHFFSGTHSDYHKPSDDEDKINYDGEQKIMEYMMQLIGLMDDRGKIEFTKTKDDSNEDAPRFKVTLGVVPDYAFDGEGMRIDGISDGKPAQKAGLKQGDIVVQLGDHKVTDMMSYMKALGAFNKGDTTKVSVKRGTETVVTDITF